MECNMENARNIKMIVAYDGTNYHGFQRQKNALAIQEVLEETMTPIFGHPVWIIGSGRTDTGVHARAQTMNFMTTSRIPTDKMPIAVNSRLPRDIAVLSAEEVDADFHSRFSAEEKTYAYQLLISECPDPFAVPYVWQIKKPLRIDLMRDALAVVVGTHDLIVSHVWMWWLLLVGILLSCYLLVAELPMFALKFKHFGWKGNGLKYGFILLSAILLIALGWAGFSAVILCYILLSVVNNKCSK